MKRTCVGCRALEYGEFKPLEYKCSLKYRIDNKRLVPLEECPKPKTLSKFVELLGGM